MVVESALESLELINDFIPTWKNVVIHMLASITKSLCVPFGYTFCHFIYNLCHFTEFLNDGDEFFFFAAIYSAVTCCCTMVD